MAIIEQIRALMKNQKSEPVASIKGGFASMKEELALELRAELQPLVQQERSKSSSAGLDGPNCGPGWGAFALVRAVFRPLHSFITVNFDSVVGATEAAAALRKLKIQYTTKAGVQMEVGIIHDRLAPIQRRRHGLHPFFTSTRRGRF